jgi:hypothetical protein
VGRPCAWYWDVLTVGVGGTTANAGAGCEEVVVPSDVLCCDRVLRFLSDDDFASCDGAESRLSLGISNTAALPPSSSALSSALRKSIHHKAPVASHALERTEWTIWAVSNPRMLSELRMFRSSAVENMSGAGWARSLA